MRARLWWRHRLGVAGGQYRVSFVKGLLPFPRGLAVYAIEPYDSILYIF